MLSHGIEVRGDVLDAETRCAHYHAACDIIAIRFACCRVYYPCHACHAAHAGHAAVLWEPDQFDARAVLCGHCGHELTIREYLACNHACPHCGAAFNPRCHRHNGLYFRQ